MTNYPVLLIDDLRDFRSELTPSGLTVARTSEAALNVLERRWGQIWLDHDLGLKSDGTEDTVMPVVERMCELAFNNRPVDVEVVLVHTSNPAGASTIQKALEAYGYRAIRVNAPEYFYVGVTQQ